MIPRGIEIFVGLEPIDLRWSFDRLCGVVEDRIGRDPRSEALFVFFGKRRTALKVFFYDGTGLCVFYKRIDKGRYRIPEPSDERATTVVIDDRELDALLDGIEVAAPRRQRRRVLH